MNLSSRKLSMRGLRTFCTASRHDTLAQAANELFVTPSAVSHQLKKLEGELGIPLFERAGRTLKLTAAGTMLLEETSSAVAVLDKAAARVQARYSRVTLRASVQPFFASELLIPRMHEFHAANPNIDIEIDASDESTQKHSGAAEVSIRLYSEAPEEMNSTRLFPLTLVTACSPQLRDQIKSQPNSSQAPFPLVVLSGRYNAWKHWSDKSGIEIPDSRNVIRLGSMSAVAQAAERGLGVALVPKQLTTSSFQAGRLVRLYENELETEDAYYLMHRTENFERQDVKTFRHWVESRFGQPEQEQLKISQL